MYNNPDTYVLYPSETAIDLTDFNQLLKNSTKNVKHEIKDNSLEVNNNNKQFFHVIIIDGTWAQASGIYYTNSELHKLKQVNYLLFL